MNPITHSNSEGQNVLSSEFGPRLVTLCDGRRGLRCALQVEPNAAPTLECSTQHPASPALPIVEFISSTEALDRYGEIISADGWRLDNYRRNPVFQNAHQYGDIIFTLGKALTTEVRQVAGRPALYQKIEFAIEANPLARIAYGLYQGKFLNAVSVGFIPLRWENGDRTEHSSIGGICPLPSDEKGSKGEGSSFRRRYLEQELLEVSAVGIPANPEALALGLATGVIEKSDLQDSLTLLSQFLSDFRSTTAALNSNTCARGVQSNGAQLLRLAYALRDLLRRS